METCDAVPTFESVDEILWCDHLNEISLAGHVVIPGTPEHRNTGTPEHGTPEHPGTPLNARNSVKNPKHHGNTF